LNAKGNQEVIEIMQKAKESVAIVLLVVASQQLLVASTIRLCFDGFASPKYGARIPCLGMMYISYHKMSSEIWRALASLRYAERLLPQKWRLRIKKTVTVTGKREFKSNFPHEGMLGYLK
jgi:hypothetical protein